MDEAVAEVVMVVVVMVVAVATVREAMGVATAVATTAPMVATVRVYRFCSFVNPTGCPNAQHMLLADVKLVRELHIF